MAKKRGTFADVANRTADHQIACRLSDRQYAALAAAAKSSGLSVGALLKDRALAAARRVRKSSEVDTDAAPFNYPKLASAKLDGADYETIARAAYTLGVTPGVFMRETALAALGLLNLSAIARAHEAGEKAGDE